MNWEAIKHIYLMVLVQGNKIEYLGDDKYRLTTFYSSGEKHYKDEWENGKSHGKSIEWYKNGQKCWETNYKNGKLHGKCISWNRSGQKNSEHKYKNGYDIKQKVTNEKEII